MAGAGSAEQDGKEAVADTLCRCPGEEHGSVGPAGCRDGGVGVDDAPDEEDAGRDLHCGGGDGGADEPEGGVERLEKGESLRVAREEAEGAVDVGCLRGGERGQEWEQGEETEQDGGP